MKNKNHFFVFCVLLVFVFSFGLYAQQKQEAGNTSNQQRDLLYTSALKDYVNELITNLSESSIGQERFLVQQIRMLNDEIKARVKGVQRVEESYFQLMNKRLSEVKALKRRLAPYHSAQLNEFLNKVQNTIQDALRSGKVDFQKQRAIEDAMQLLYVAEEMIKMDPNAKIEKDAKFTNNLRSTERKLTANSLMGANYGNYKNNVQGKKKATIYDLYQEWKRNEQVKYELRWTDVEIIKKKLLRDGTTAERERMFKRELRQAANAFNYGLYDLAERSFNEILNRYSFVGKLDDCLYYKGLSNFLLDRYLAAQSDFEQFLNDYPSSLYLPKVYRYLMQIAMHFENYPKVLNYYEAFHKTGIQSGNLFDETTFMAATAALKTRQYEKAINYLSLIGKNSPFYFQAQYLLAEAFVGVNNYNEAKRILKELASNDRLNPEFHNKILLKLGLLYYDEKNYENAIATFNLIDQGFSQYDRVLLGYGWSYFKQQMALPASERDFSNAEQSLNTLIDTFYGSDYLLEAKTLLGYIHQLQNESNKAISDYQYVYSAREAKGLSDALNQESEVLGKMINQAKSLERKALRKDDPSAFHKAYNLRKKLYKPYLRVTYLDLSSSGFGVQHEVERLNSQLQELERLRQEAKAQQRKDLVKRIERMEYRIYSAINSIKEDQPSPLLGVNYFDAHPSARKESVIEARNKQILEMRKDIESQRNEIVKRLNELDILINQTKREKNYKKLVALELSKDHFTDLLKKLDFLQTQAYGMGIKNTNINLNRWSDFGVFGLTSVKFNVKMMTTKEIKEMQKRIQDINTFLKLRRQNIEHKIRQINDQIIVMTRKVRQRERLRKRAELNRQFEQTYFDTHDTELNYEEGQPQPAPKSKEENPKENQQK